MVLRTCGLMETDFGRSLTLQRICTYHTLALKGWRWHRVSGPRRSPARLVRVIFTMLFVEVV